MTDTLPLIKLENVSFTYMPDTPFARQALDNVSLQIDPGEAVGIVGAAGSGKSTLIQHFNALLTATSGNVHINGREISDSSKGSELAEVRFKVGMLFQFPEQQLFEETVFEDVAFGPRNMGLCEDEVRLRSVEALDKVGLGDIDYMNLSPFQLSGGQKRRAALAGVLAMKPSCLVLDEPTAGLDPRGAEEILSLLNSLHKNGTGIVMVSHRFDETASVCDRVVVMHQGKIAADGPLKEIFYAGSILEEAGLSAPEVCRVAAYLRDAGFHIEGMPTEAGEAASAILRAAEER